jgi:prolyl-tRNA synthetase
MLTDEEVKVVSKANPGSCGPIDLQIPIYADNGIMGLKNFITGANEDGFHFRNVNIDRDFKINKTADLRMAKEGDCCPSGKGFLKAYRGIEVGHVFYLGTKYSEKMKATYLDKNGKSQLLQMGCYGIGVSRTIQAAIEQCFDVDGIIWPKSIAPYHVHICVLDINKEKVMDYANKLMTDLESENIEVLMDDRDERPGSKFKDADLLGMPVRIVLGERGLNNNEVEVTERKTKTLQKVKPEDVIATVKKLLQ